MKKIILKITLFTCFIAVFFFATGCTHKHEFSSEWTKDANEHWHVCTVKDCDEVENKAAHTFGEAVVVAATADADGSSTKTCTVCGYEQVTVLCNHVGHIEKVGYTRPSVLKDGYQEHYECSECGQWFSDDDRTHEITKESIAISKSLFGNEPNADFPIYDLEVKSTLDLGDDWTINKYDNGWKDCGATLGIYTTDNYKALKFGLWDNTIVFRYSLSYDTMDAYKAISFNAQGNDITTLKVQLANSVSGYYVTYKAITLSSSLTTYTISMSDISNWKVIDGSIDFQAAAAALGINDPKYVIGCFDTINFIYSGYTPNGVKSTVYMNDLKFLKTAADTSEKMILNDKKDNYAFTDSQSNKHYFVFNRDPEVKTVTVDSQMVFNYVESGTGITLTSDTLGTINASYKANGRQIKIDTVTSNIPQVSGMQGVTVVCAANVNLDFNDLTSGFAYNNSQWTKQYYGNSGWTNFTGNMNVRNVDGNNNVNIYVDTNTRNYTYNLSNSEIGTANSFSLKIANYFANSGTIKLKISVTTTSGEKIYLDGDANTFVDLAFDSSKAYTTYAHTINAKEIASVTITVKVANGSAYGYLDDFVIAY